MEEIECKVEPVAYGKVILHSAKYFYCAVNGVLVGTVDGGRLTVVDAVAVMHGQLGTAPLMEAALAQIERRFAGQGLQIVGYYQGNEMLDDNTPGQVAARIGDRIRDTVPAACVLMIDNEALIPERLEKECALRLWVRPKGRNAWVQRGKVEVAGGEEVLRKLAPKLSSPAYFSKLFDFDDHCDDVRRDYFNAALDLL